MSASIFRKIGFSVVLVAIVVSLLVYRYSTVSVVSAAPLPADCPEGQICARIIDYTGGCTSAPCCPPNQTMCASNDSRVPGQYPRIAAANPGTCIELKEEVIVCSTWECDLANTCAQGSCQAVDPVRHSMARTYRSTGQACPAGALH